SVPYASFPSNVAECSLAGWKCPSAVPLLWICVRESIAGDNEPATVSEIFTCFEQLRYSKFSPVSTCAPKLDLPTISWKFPATCVPKSTSGSLAKLPITSGDIHSHIVPICPISGTTDDGNAKPNARHFC